MRLTAAAEERLPAHGCFIVSKLAACFLVAIIKRLSLTWCHSGVKPLRQFENCLLEYHDIQRILETSRSARAWQTGGQTGAKYMNLRAVTKIQITVCTQQEPVFKWKNLR